MKFNSQIYLDCYSNLHSPQGSKQANKTLLQIYESDEAWKIAEELMLNKSHMIHGSQLLSQKLNSSIPPEVNPQVLAQFILSVKSISNLHWLCLAKLFIHTHQSINQLQIQGNLSIDIKLNILKEIPHAVTQLRIQFGVKSSDYKAQVYQQNKKLILDAIHFLTENKNNLAPEIAKLQDLVFQVLQSFTQCDVRLNCQEIARFVLQFSDSDRVSNLFEHIFLEQKYPNLDEKVQIFLKANLNNQEKDWIKTFYLNFYAKRDIFTTFSVENYMQVLKTATLMMATKQEDEFRSILSDSYEFWLSLINKISTTKGGQQQSKQLNQKQVLLKQSLFVIFEELCKHSKLKKCPLNIKTIESNLDIIDLDSEEGIVQSKMGSNFQDEFSELNYNVNQIREMSMDLLIKIQEGLKTDHELYRKMFESLFVLASSQDSHQSLELAIFIVDGMTDCCDEFSKPFLSDLIKVILDQKSMQNEYICQRIVILLGKIDKIIVSNVTVLPSVFEFFSNSIAYEKLSSLASESFTDLMDQYQVQNFVVDQQFKEKSQTYLNFWFETFYGKIKTEKVLENITKALVIFIYKFKGPEYYQKFLVMMNGKINSESNQSLKDIYLEAVVTGQNWINSRQSKEDQQYLTVFSNFMNQFLDILLGNCFKANRKPDFTKAVGKINWALKAGSYFTSIQRWLQMIKQIIKKSLFQSQGDILSVGLTPLITLMKSQYLDLKHLSAICQTLQTVINPITTLFINFHQSKTTLDYNFSKYVMQMHNLTVALILKHPDITQNNLVNYDPAPMFLFIKDKIFKNKTFWEFEVYKETLIFLHELTLSNYQVEDICFEVLSICGRTLQSLWIQTENIFLSAYKKLGIIPFVNSLQKLKPEVLAPNPLFSLLQEGLENSDRKVLKSFARCL